MSDLTTVRAEFFQVNDREILLELLVGQRTQNGAIAAIKGDFYGDPDRKIDGVKQKVEAHELQIERARTSARTLIAVVGILGAGNLWAWITVMARG